MNRARVSFEDALAATLHAITPLATEPTPLQTLVGRVVAEDVIAPMDAPTADVSLKDGYAVRSADVAGASREEPVPLRLVGHVAAGGAYGQEVAPGTTVRVLSGAPLPVGADAVLAEEYAVRDDECVTALADAEPGRNVLFRGIDFERGSCLVSAGTVLRPAQVGLLAAAGYAVVSAVRRPRVGLVAVGDELVVPMHAGDGAKAPAHPGDGPVAPADSDDGAVAPAHPGDGRESAEPLLGHGQVFSSNLANMAAWCGHYGLTVSEAVVRDERAALRQTLLAALERSDVVLTSGGAWNSERDLVVGVLDELGWRQSYHRVRLGPGKGVGFGMWRDKYVFVLPGGPASCQMGFVQLALPALHRMMGYARPGGPTRPARLTVSVKGQRTWTEFVEGRFEWDGAELCVVPAKGRSRLRSMAECECYIRIPEGTEVLEAGTLTVVQVLPDVPGLRDCEPGERRLP